MRQGEQMTLYAEQPWPGVAKCQDKAVRVTRDRTGIVCI
jgi:hypothetical protein